MLAARSGRFEDHNFVLGHLSPFADFLAPSFASAMAEE